MKKCGYAVHTSISSADHSHHERDHCIYQTKVYKQYKEQGHKVNKFLKQKTFKRFLVAFENDVSFTTA